MTKDKALKLALEIALEKEYQLRKTGQSHMIEPVITAIKEALAPTSTQCEVQPEQEPVAWRLSNEAFDYQITSYDEEQANTYIKNGWHLIDVLYTTPPKRPWVGLTDEDCKGMSAGDKVVAMWANRTLKEKNT